MYQYFYGPLLFKRLSSDFIIDRSTSFSQNVNENPEIREILFRRVRGISIKEKKKILSHTFQLSQK